MKIKLGLNIQKFITLISLLMVHQSFAKELKFEDLKWNVCPKTEKEFVERLQNFDSQLSTYFAEKSHEDLISIFDSETEESTYLRLFAPFLIEPSKKSHFDRNCWIIFQDFTKSLSAKDSSKSVKLNEQWLSCIEFNYRAPQSPSQEITQCFKSYRNK